MGSRCGPDRLRRRLSADRAHPAKAGIRIPAANQRLTRKKQPPRCRAAHGEVLKFMRLLIVEDDLPLARRISAALIEAGHAPIAVHDGETAVDRALEASFDLIVLDVG